MATNPLTIVQGVRKVPVRIEQGVQGQVRQEPLQERGRMHGGIRLLHLQLQMDTL